MKKTRAVAGLVVCSLVLFSGTRAAEDVSTHSRVKQIPIEIDRNRVIIPTYVDGSGKLKIILDTGMRFDGVYLFHQDLLSALDTTGAVQVRVPGAGAGEASTAVMIENGRLRFGDLEVDSQRVLISQSAHTQTFPSDGVTGWNLFGHYVVEIDYDNQLISLHDTTAIEVDSTWVEVPISLKKDIPFLECPVEVVQGEVVTMTLYIDLASGDALELLVKPEQRFTLPDNLEERYLGTGLSGDINGHFGYSHRLTLAGCDLFDVPTAFAPAAVRSRQEGAHGVLGNNAIRRFNVIFDYFHGRLYFKPNSFFKTPFQ